MFFVKEHQPFFYEKHQPFFYEKHQPFFYEKHQPFFYEKHQPFFYEEHQPFFLKIPALFPELPYINDTTKKVTVKEVTVKEVTVKTVKCITPSNKPSKVYTRKQRWAKIKLWKEKKARFFSSRRSTIRYPVRQQHSVTRPRVKGKFC